MYLIISELNPDRLLVAKRVSVRVGVDFTVVRELLAARYPGKQVFSSLESHRLPDARQFVVYNSLSKDGVGRCNGNFHLWSVER